MFVDSDLRNRVALVSIVVFVFVVVGIARHGFPSSGQPTHSFGRSGVHDSTSAFWGSVFILILLLASTLYLLFWVAGLLRNLRKRSK